MSFAKSSVPRNFHSSSKPKNAAAVRCPQRSKRNCPSIPRPASHRDPPVGCPGRQTSRRWHISCSTILPVLTEPPRPVSWTSLLPGAPDVAAAARPSVNPRICMLLFSGARREYLSVVFAFYEYLRQCFCVRRGRVKRLYFVVIRRPDKRKNPGDRSRKRSAA